MQTIDDEPATLVLSLAATGQSSQGHAFRLRRRWTYLDESKLAWAGHDPCHTL